MPFRVTSVVNGAEGLASGPPNCLCVLTFSSALTIWSLNTSSQWLFFFSRADLRIAHSRKTMTRSDLCLNPVNKHNHLQWFRSQNNTDIRYCITRLVSSPEVCLWRYEPCQRSLMESAGVNTCPLPPATRETKVNALWSRWHKWMKWGGNGEMAIGTNGF